MTSKLKFYDITAWGCEVDIITLTNSHGLAVSFITYGCRLTSVLLPGWPTPADVALGFGSLREYECDTAYHGAVVGRYANRIRGASFDLGGRRYQLTKNEGANYLHGSFHRHVFEVAHMCRNRVVLTTHSPDGEDGFPGNQSLTVTYSLDDLNRFTAVYEARSDMDTHVNITNHTYFDLSAGADDTILEHTLRLASDAFLPLDVDRCPTGEITAVGGGPFDFRQEKPIGRDIEVKDRQLELAGGYDHCFILGGRAGGDRLKEAARLCHADSGRALTVFTTQPALQLYTGNFLAGARGKERPHNARGGVCLETGHYPDSPNNSAFPSTLLRKDEVYREATVFKFEF